MAYSSTPLTLFALTLLLSSLLISTRAQQQIPDCAAKLVPCGAYVTSRNPPESCCGPLRETIATQRDCLCSLYNNPALVQAFGINVTQSLELPKNCNITSDTTLCDNASAPAPSSGLLTPPPPGVPGGDNNGAGKIAWAGASGLLMFWVSILAY